MTPEQSESGTRLYPLLVAASIGVIAFVGAGTAAIVVWIPAAQSSATPALAVSGAPADAASSASARNTRGGVDCENCGTVETVTAFRTSGGSSGLGSIAGVGEGAYAGGRIKREMRREIRYRVVVRTDEGGTQTFTDSAGRWKPGDRVRIADGNLIATTPGG